MSAPALSPSLPLRRRVALLALVAALVPAGAAFAEESAPRRSRALSLASAEQVEQMSVEQYRKLLAEAARQKALAPRDHPQVQRLRRIAAKLIEHAPRYNERARGWNWEVNLIGSRQVNAFAMPGGKIAFFSGLIDRLELSDDEIAMVMAHEIAHALQEHGRERVGKARLSQWATIGASVLSQVLGYGDLGGHLAAGGSQLLMLKYGRDDETEADALGMELAARAGYDPRAALTLWRKMAAVNQGQRAPLEWMSTHPSHESRMREIEARLPALLPIYAKASGRQVSSVAPAR